MARHTIKGLKNKDNLLVGVISDTHGILFTEALQALKGCDLIVHAGDIGRQDVLDSLNRIAPVIAVRGNMDSGGWSRDLPDVELVEIGNVVIYILHDVTALDLEPATAGISAVISGHSHRPAAAELDGVLFLNPGSSAYPRYKTPASVALLNIRQGTLTPRFIDLKI